MMSDVIKFAVLPIVVVSIAHWVKRTPLLNEIDKGVIGLILIAFALVCSFLFTPTWHHLTQF